MPSFLVFAYKITVTKLNTAGARIPNNSIPNVLKARALVPSPTLKKELLNKQDLVNRFNILEGGYRVQSPFGAKMLCILTSFWVLRAAKSWSKPINAVVPLNIEY